MDEEKKVEDKEDSFISDNLKEEDLSSEEVSEQEESNESELDEQERIKEEMVEENINDSERDKEGISESSSDEESESVEGEKKEENTNENKEIVKKQNNQIKWAVFLMLGLIVIIVLVPYIKLNYFDKFNYNGLDFQKTRLGELTFYSAKFPVVSGTGQVIGDYSVNLRKDPRDLEYIPVNISNDNIQFSIDEGKLGDVYISLYPFINMCDGDSLVAMANLAGFLRDSGLEVRSAFTDKAYARDNNQTHKWCSPFETVFVISDDDVFTEGNETSITEIGLNCYELKFKDCEVLEVSEKLMLLVLGEYAERFSEK